MRSKFIFNDNQWQEKNLKNHDDIWTIHLPSHKSSILSNNFQDMPTSFSKNKRIGRNMINVFSLIVKLYKMTYNL